MDTNLRTNINRLTVGFLEEIIQLGGVAYTKESAENELKRRKEEVLGVANKYIDKCFIRIYGDSTYVYKFINHIRYREILYYCILIDCGQNFINYTHDDACTVYIEDIEEMLEDCEEISEEEYNKYVEKYNKISEFANQIIKE